MDKAFPFHITYPTHQLSRVSSRHFMKIGWTNCNRSKLTWFVYP